MSRILFISLGIFLLNMVAACGFSSYHFMKAAPVTSYNDMQPGPVPEKNDFMPASYQYDLLVRRPVVQGMEVSKHTPSRDVNAFDDVPSSSWYTQRLGYREITPEDLLRGPQKIGPPQSPFKVAKAKHGGGNPGFIIKDARSYLYLVKFDPPQFPGVETTTALIVNRLYWGFGFNVPEDYLVFFHRDDFLVDPNGELTREDVDKVLKLVAPPVDGVYRSTVSLFIRGNILGPIPATGTRKGDINDKFAHENRRVLRALRVFNAFTNHTDMRIDNTLDVYEGEAGKGFVRHYMLDFGEAFAGHAMEHDRLWDGFTHVFSFKYMARNLFTLGARVEGWENIKYTPWQSVGTFESQVYNPATWKEVLPYVPIQYSGPDDNYWAAKVVGALTDEHIKTLVDAAQYPEEGAGEYVVKILKERRQKTLDYFFSKISPIEFSLFADGKIVLEDRGNIVLKRDGTRSRYQVRFLNGDGKKIVAEQTLEGQNNLIKISLSKKLINNAKGYLRLDVLKIRNEKKAPRPAQFHIRGDQATAMQLVGIVH